MYINNVNFILILQLQWKILPILLVIDDCTSWNCIQWTRSKWPFQWHLWACCFE